MIRLRAARASFVLLGAASCSEPPRAERGPDLLLISIDTLRQDSLRAFDPRARARPSLDELAQVSVRFPRAYSTASWTLPAQASLFTGLYPDRHGATDPGVSISPEAAILGELLRDHGYETVAFTEGLYLDRRFGYGRGFNRYNEWTGDRTGQSPASLPRGGRPHSVAGRSPFDRAIAFLKQRAAGDPPLFLFLHTYTVHDYFEFRPWALRAIGSAARVTAERAMRCLTGQVTCAPATWQQLRLLYEAETNRLDRHLGRLLGTLRAVGLWDTSVVVLISDHGEGFDFRRGRVHHAGRLHADLVAAPLLLRVPGEPGRSVHTPVSLVDVMPTLLDLLGLPPVAGLDGRSLAAAVRGDGELEPVPLYTMEHAFSWEADGRALAEQVEERPLSLAVIAGDRWYVMGTDEEELYSLPADPDQERNLAPSDAQIEELRALARARMRDRPDTLPAELPDSSIERLRALGYVE